MPKGDVVKKIKEGPTAKKIREKLAEKLPRPTTWARRLRATWGEPLIEAIVTGEKYREILEKRRLFVGKKELSLRDLIGKTNIAVPVSILNEEIRKLVNRYETRNQYLAAGISHLLGATTMSIIAAITARSLAEGLTQTITHEHISWPPESGGGGALPGGGEGITPGETPETGPGIQPGVTPGTTGEAGPVKYTDVHTVKVIEPGALTNFLSKIPIINLIAGFFYTGATYMGMRGVEAKSIDKIAEIFRKNGFKGIIDHSRLLEHVKDKKLTLSEAEQLALKKFVDPVQRLKEANVKNFVGFYLWRELTQEYRALSPKEVKKAIKEGKKTHNEYLVAVFDKPVYPPA